MKICSYRDTSIVP